MISALILAAGSSERLGTPKQLLDLDGKPVLQHVIDRAAGCSVDEIVVVLGHHARLIEEALDLSGDVRVVINRDYSLGQSTSLRVGVDAVDAHSRAAAILLGDQPRIPPEAIEQVIEAFHGGHKPIARARYRGTPGHPVIVDRAAFGLFVDLSGDEGARTLLRLSPDVEVVDIDDDVPVDIDTWADYESLVR